VRDAIRNDFSGGSLRLLHGVLPGFTIEDKAQFGNIGDPAPVFLTVEFDRELPVSIILRSNGNLERLFVRKPGTSILAVGPRRLRT
jgi:hypothetical protein